MNRKLLVTLMVAVLTAVSPALATQFTGGIGYFNTNSALTLPPGALDMSLYVRGYVSFFNKDIGSTINNGTSALSAAFGYTRHTELGFTQILSQDYNLTPISAMDRKNGMYAIIPGDTYIRFKFGGYQATNNIYWGVMPMLQYRVARYHNIQLEPFSTDAIQMELTGLASYYQKPLYPEEGISAHLNLGFQYFNDGNQDIPSSKAVNVLASFYKPWKGQFGYGGEVNGQFFTERPGKNAFGREDWLYVTPFARYDLFLGLKFTVGLDVLVIGSEETSKPANVDHSLLNDYPNYPPWRLNMRVNFMPSTSFFTVPTFVKATEGESALTAGRRRSSVVRSTSGTSTADRQAMFKWAIEERGGQIEAIELDLDKIRQERQKAEEELERLRKELEKRKEKSK